MCSPATGSRSPSTPCPRLALSGRVTHIKPIGENKQGDITYTVLVELDEQNEQLRWNMTAQTTIFPDDVGRSERPYRPRRRR